METLQTAMQGFSQIPFYMQTNALNNQIEGIRQQYQQLAQLQAQASHAVIDTMIGCSTFRVHTYILTPKVNPKIAALQVEFAHVDGEIEKLADSLTGANNVLLSYVKIEKLDGCRQELVKRIANLTVEPGTGQSDFRLPRHLGQRIL